MDQEVKRRGRPPTFDRDQALEVATELFWRHGYEGTSIALLTERMGITPPTLYAAFGSKACLYRHVFARLRELGRRGEGTSSPRPGSLFRILEVHLRDAAVRFTDPARPRGCMVAVGGLQCGADNDHARETASAERITDLVDFVARIEDAKRMGDVAAATDPAALARFYAAVHQGMAVQAIDGASAAELNTIVDVALAAWPKV